MIRYTKHKIIRVSELNDKYYEVLFQKDSLNFCPGSYVTLYKDRDYPLFIASGISEPWCRLIVNCDVFSLNFFAAKDYIKLNLEIDNKLPLLMAEKNPSFIITSDMISPFFSYSSTYPEKKCKVCYLGDYKISMDWIKANHDVVSLSKIKKEKDLYILVEGSIIRDKARTLLNNCKCSYIT